MCAYMENTVYAIRCVYLWIMVGAVIQDLFLFLFKTKDRERSEPNKPREKRAPYYGGKKNQQTKT